MKVARPGLTHRWTQRRTLAGRSLRNLGTGVAIVLVLAMVLSRDWVE